MLSFSNEPCNFTDLRERITNLESQISSLVEMYLSDSTDVKNKMDRVLDCLERRNLSSVASNGSPSDSTSQSSTEPPQECRQTENNVLAEFTFPLSDVDSIKYFNAVLENEFSQNSEPLKDLVSTMV